MTMHKMTIICHLNLEAYVLHSCMHLSHAGPSQVIFVQYVLLQDCARDVGRVAEDPLPLRGPVKQKSSRRKREMMGYRVLLRV